MVKNKKTKKNNKPKNSKQKANFGKSLYSWKAKERAEYKEDKKWLFIMGAIALSFIVFPVFFGAWSFSLAIGAVCLVYYIELSSENKEIEVKISKFGISVDDKVIPFSLIQGFWILYEPPIKKLYIRVTGELKRDLYFRLEDQNPSEIRDILKKYVKEFKGQTPTFSDYFSQILKI